MRERIILTAIILSVLCACGSDNQLRLKDADSREIYEDSDIFLTVSSVLPSEISYQIVNNSDMTVTFGGESDFILEVQKGNKWYYFTFAGQDWTTTPRTLDLFGCSAGEVRQYTANWKDFWGELPAGTYRILKKCSVRSNDNGTAETEGKATGIYYHLGRIGILQDFP